MMYNHSGECLVDTTLSPASYGEEYEYICVRIEDEETFTTSTEMFAPSFIGAYRMDSSADNGLDGVPRWIKPANSWTDSVMSIYYDEMYGHWQIGSGNASASMICMSDSTFPEECDLWFDTLNAKALSNIMTIEVEQCTAADMIEMEEEV